MQNSKELQISQIYCPMENPMDWVHGACTGRCGSRALGLTGGGGGGQAGRSSARGVLTGA
jgi:hypothetical protein